MSDYAILIIGALATWRLSKFLVHEDGPGDIGAKFRWFVGGWGGFWKELLDCMWCTSIWVGALYTVLFGASTWLFLLTATPFAFSAVAVIIEVKFFNG